MKKNDGQKSEQTVTPEAEQTANAAKQQPATAEPAPTAEVDTSQLEQLAAQNAELQAENEKLKKTVARLQSSADKSDTYLNQLVAMKSDFESYKRRMKFNAEQARTEGVQSVALKLIAIADTFELAAKHLTDDDNKKAFDMVYQQFVQTLAEMGVTAMNVLGAEFDHMTMNALSQMDYGAENSGKVVEVYKNGYMMGEKVLRYAEVIVGA